jgi:hypothetical protein
MGGGQPPPERYVRRYLAWAEIAGLLGLLALGGLGIAHWWRDLFGAGTWGTGGNMVAWVICGVLAGLWLRAKMQAHTALQMAQARRHHDEKMAQSGRQHQEIMDLTRQLHEQRVQLAEAHQAELKAHITRQVAQIQPVVVAAAGESGAGAGDEGAGSAVVGVPVGAATEDAGSVTGTVGETVAGGETGGG